MAAVVSDSAPEPADEQRPNNIQPSNAQESILKAGIFHADADTHIAQRLADKMKTTHCRTELFTLADCGNAKLDNIEKWIEANNLVLWLATNTSLQDDGILKAARHIAQHAGIVRKDLNIRFVVLQPHEYLNVRLPLSLDAYTSLKEDNMFEKRLDTTINSIRKSRAKARSSAAQYSTAGTDAVTDDVEYSLRQARPNSDDALAEQTLQHDGEAGVALCAVPNSGDVEEKPATQPLEQHGDSGQGHTTNVVNLYIDGQGHTIQVGNDMITNQLSKEKKKKTRLPDDA